AVSHRNPVSSADVRLGDGTEANLAVPMAGPVVTDLAMALDADSHPHIAFDRSDTGLGYARWDGATWHVEQVDPSIGVEVALALDADGLPSIARPVADRPRRRRRWIRLVVLTRDRQ
ncbi:MAG TPA: hypothetical protein VGH63_03080, partial [Polyangia bacterium]